MPELDIIVKATVDQATQGLITVQRGLSNTAIAATKMDSALQKTSASVKGAGFALTSVNRVIQDIPFGLIGIGNNLEQLPDAFRQLSIAAKESGRSMGSLLLSSLAGFGGLGLAVSAVTTAFTLAQVGFSAWTRGMGGAKQATDEMAKAVDGFKESIAKQTIEFNILAKVSADTEIPLKTRLEAINKLRDAYPTHLKNLSDEQILTGQLGAAYEKINSALLAKVSLQAAEEKLIPVLKQQIDARLKLKDAADFLAKTPTISKEELANNPKLAQLYVDRLHAQQDVNQETKKSIELQNQLNKTLSSLTDIIRETAPLDLDKNDKSKKSVDQIAETLRKLAIDIDELNSNPLILKFDKPLKEIELIQKAIERLRDLKAPEPIIQKLRVEIDNLSLAAVGGQLEKQFGNLKNFKLPDLKPPEVKIIPYIDFSQIDNDFAQLKGKVEAMFAKTKLTLPVNFEARNARELEEDLKRGGAAESLQKFAKDNHIKIRVDLDKLDTAQLKAFESKLQSAVSEMQASMESFLTTSFTDLFSTIGSAIGGDANPFQKLFSSLADGLKSLGGAMIKYGVTVGILQKVLAKPFSPLTPALSILAGIGLQVAAALLKNSIPKFEQGGIVSSPTLALIGERGKEAVIPLERLNDYITPRNEQNGFVASTRISGQDLIILIERGKRHNGRTY